MNKTIDFTVHSEPGWKGFNKITKKSKKFKRILNHQAKLCSYNTAPKFKYVYELPCNYQHTLELDTRKNTRWMDATDFKLV